MTLDEELKLVEQAKSNIQAFEKLYQEYFNKIFGYCYNRLSSKELTEDVTSYVFMKAVEDISKFDTSKNVRFSSWLYKTAHNKIIDIYRKNGKRKIIELIENLEPSENSIDKHISRHQKRIEISATLIELKPRYQQVISLRFLSELELDEISEIMNLSTRNISVLLSRATDAFRKLYKKKFPESEIFSNS